MKHIIFPFTAILLLLSCKQNSRNTGDVSKANKIEEIELSSNTLNDSILENKKIDTVLVSTITIDTDSIKHLMNDYVLHAYYPNSNYRPLDRYLYIPYIVENEKEYYAFDQYPKELIVRLIPTTVDTLEVISGTGNCMDCLDIFKIQDKNEVELFYSLSSNNKIIAQKGKLDSILSKRDISFELLWDSKYIEATLTNWAEDVELNDLLNTYYYLPTAATLQKKPNIEGINKLLFDTKQLTTYSLDTLQILYNNHLNTKDVIRMDNFLTNDNEGYFHSGELMKDIEEDVLLLVESLDILYISQQNEIFKVAWLNDYTTVLNSIGILDDSRASIIDNYYTINDWATGTKTRLFHPAMVDNDYLVVYELKLKDINTYIQSSAEIISFKKPMVADSIQ
ncbi:hypothetical protein M601_003650 [Cellulophaga baltica 4]|nr:hypothetical protein M601_003650 [Cellulophaga baltica 4]